MSQQSPAARVQQIFTNAIAPNPHNPRRLFDEDPMAELRKSIAKLGILVPVTVYEPEQSRSDRKEYVLLDGERRWRCATELNLDSVPAIIVAEPNETRNILTMFHIHNVREGWQLMPTALKLQTLMGNLRTTNERQLAEITQLSIPQVRRCKILLSYPKKYHRLMLAPPNVRLKADFFIELERIRGPARRDGLKIWKRFGDIRCIDALLEKYLKGTIRAVTDFRKLSEMYRVCKEKDKIPQFEKQFRRLITIKSMTIDDLSIRGATFAKEIKEIKRSAHRLMTQIDDVGIDAIATDTDAIALLKKLMRQIQRQLRGALLSDPREGD